MKLTLKLTAAASALALIAGAAQAETLRLLTWGGYAPDAVIDAFEAETGIEVEVTLSNNEDMISKLRATGGAGFDLAQPSQDRILGPQMEFGIYKPLDQSKLDKALWVGDLYDASIKSTTVDGQAYGVAHIWGSSGFAMDRSRGEGIKTWVDLCKPEYAGRISMRLKRTALLGMSFGLGDDPFAAYDDPVKYEELMKKAAAKLAECKPNVKAYWSGSDDLLAMMRSGEVIAAEAWDATGFKLYGEDTKFNFVAPETGALGWIDTFALPAKGEADDAAYAWINFVMRPEIAAQIIEASGAFSASKGSDELVSPVMKAAYQEAFTPDVIANIKWFPPVPAGLEDIEGRLLDEVAAK
ncbi:extracellular solute-binding protein [Frigidibacter sp. ROC022]|uniref:extracellular solute-binding protein n=1 Tax=Frigidibacter sp. ROC022 TaxID=2971796 RepID=UPI00215ABFC3|nr:extracellular solute-binding protein [Frigidibacter sp. ROC022]MCR8723306.1 extracellular solute-binding protein [Frigidibacter sp. ROC022]